MTSIYEFSCNTSKGEKKSLKDYQGQVMLIVNTASKCGFTPQFEGLEALHEKYAAKGLAILGFPCNQFGHQDPGNDAEILSFCQTKFDVKFPMFAKVEVNGSDADPLFKYLKAEAPGLLGSTGIKWNFTKFLVSRKGKVLERFAPTVTPADLEEKITALL
ncbi:MAG: glutathione peroxidase [Gammaproteobacteria bacterium]|jgi:glutathione peroxidase|nr:glutathione peroxidase [Gammaproteobacteria bacterium]MBP6052338.1 glutathione peroxidase [Pseudomonadales bacterium]MBK6584788.1 glutathione peroxidase [Gammaproteobacteria bacterium]MBK7169964.1 glutathione peroxidase [Gammaproteobacteria bacterium]MBK7519701.1 glutathione peroxidase [Gammaproteobacteria bacterium]